MSERGPGRPFPVVHGHARWSGKSPEYRTWRHINIRCHNQNSAGYAAYGGRGIVVCDEWRTSFQAFLAAVGPKPSPAHSLDRFPNNGGHYEPGNVRWATRSEQARNRSTSKLTEEQVENARRLLSDGHTQRSVAAMLGVSNGLISHINTGRSWRRA